MKTHWIQPGTFATLFENLPGISGLLIAMLASQQWTGSILLGGALFIAGQLGILCACAWCNRREPHRDRLRYLWIVLASLPPLAAVALEGIARMHLRNFLLIAFFVVLQLPGSMTVQRKSAVHSSRAVNLSILVVAVISFGLFGICAQGRLIVLALIYHGLVSVLTLLRHMLHVDIPTYLSDNELDNMMSIYACRQFWNMNIGVSVALETSILLWVGYLPYFQPGSLWGALLQVAVLLVIYLLATAFSCITLRGFLRRAIGKNTVFLVFSVLWMAANVYLSRHPSVGLARWYTAYALLCLCISSLLTVTLSMDEDMQSIGVTLQGFTPQQYDGYKARIRHWSHALSRLALLYVIGIMTVVYRGQWSNPIPLVERYALLLLPAFFLLIAVAASLRQPFTAYYEQKLSTYLQLIRQGEVNRALEERLKLVLVRKYSKRFGIRFIMFLLKPIFNHKLIGRQNVQTKDFPAVFVCNHSEVYGPAAAVLNLPFYVRPWIMSEMVDTQKIGSHIQQSFDRNRWIPRALRERMGVLLGPVVAWAMNAMDPIPVYRSDIRQLHKSLSMSVDALEAEDNLLIFPENPGDTGYLRNGVGEFFTGFVDIARQYYKRTGHSLTFYAVYAHKATRTFCFAPGVAFNPKEPYSQEKRRVADELHRDMTALYEQQQKEATGRRRTGLEKRSKDLKNTIDI